MKKVSWSEFVRLYHGGIMEEDLVRVRMLEGSDGLADMVCEVFDSSRLGLQTAMAFGPKRTFKSISEIEARKQGVYITGMPSSAAFCHHYTTDMPVKGDV